MWNFVIMGAMVLISLFNKPKTPKPKPQAMTSDSLPRCKDGTSKAIGFGQVKSKDFIVFWLGGKYTIAIKQKGGKK